jgi:hypothetical protein
MSKGCLHRLRTIGRMSKALLPLSGQGGPNNGIRLIALSVTNILKASQLISQLTPLPSILDTGVQLQWYVYLMVLIFPLQSCIFHRLPYLRKLQHISKSGQTPANIISSNFSQAPWLIHCEILLALSLTYSLTTSHFFPCCYSSESIIISPLGHWSSFLMGWSTSDLVSVYLWSLQQL